MLTIREDQMAAFAAVSRESFEDRMTAAIAEGYPAKYAELSEAGTRQFVRRAIETGARHNVRTEGGVAVLIELTIEFGEGFALAPDRTYARKTLAHPALPEVVKLAAIRERLTARTQGRTLDRFEPGACE